MREATISIPDFCNVRFSTSFIDNTVKIHIYSMEDLNNIIEQCKDIKLRWLAEVSDDHSIGDGDWLAVEPWIKVRALDTELSIMEVKKYD